MLPRSCALMLIVTLAVPSRFFRASSIARAFKAIFADFRQRYVLRYSPNGVPSPGWHPIAVTVPSAQGATIRARQGYYGGP